jgi:hypothetical protein
MALRERAAAFLFREPFLAADGGLAVFERASVIETAVEYTPGHGRTAQVAARRG